MASRKPPTKKFLPLFFLFFLIGVLILTVIFFDQIRFYFGQALGQKADIVINPLIKQGQIDSFWRNLSQGGEENELKLTQVKNQIAPLKLKYIRLDHLYDFYEPVQRNDQQLVFNWQKLDQAVNQILELGAIPFLSLSYMPPAIAKEGNIIGQPENWPEWELVIQRTIEHFSGRNNRNLKGVIYEVWNEPDLFGSWKTWGDKNYLTLYHYAATGAQKAQNTNSFKIGGPAITAPYRNWVFTFLDYIAKNNLRLDFYSWHRYSLNPKTYLEDIDLIDTWLFKNAGYSLEKYLTEWGPDSENSPVNDNNFAAAHLIASARQMIGRVDLGFVFEAYDGPSPSGNKLWGRWGILTYPGNPPIITKPRYQAFKILNQMEGERISLTGEGDWVTGFAVKNKETIKIILTNLDPRGRHQETFPLTINHLDNQAYSFKQTFLYGIANQKTIFVANQTLFKEIILTANNITLIEISPFLPAKK